MLAQYEWVSISAFPIHIYVKYISHTSTQYIGLNNTPQTICIANFNRTSEILEWQNLMWFLAMFTFQRCNHIKYSPIKHVTRTRQLNCIHTSTRAAMTTPPPLTWSSSVPIPLFWVHLEQFLYKRRKVSRRRLAICWEKKHKANTTCS